MRKLIFVIFSIYFISNSIFAQIGLRTNGNHLISLKFLHQKIEAKANESFFNILTISNNSDKNFTGTVRYTQPANWSIIGENEINININPYDSLKIPVRVIVSNTVMGEIAYAVVAGLFDNNNRPLLSEYCFINIPRVSDLKVKAPNRILYFDNKTKSAKFKYAISNQGNTNEIVQLKLNGNENLSVKNNSLIQDYVSEYSIPAHTDTVIDIDVKLNQVDLNKDFYKLDATAYTQDSLFTNRLWFNKINSSYNHSIPEDNKCAIVELTASNILSKQKPTYSLMAKGSLLLKRNTDFYYFFNKYDLSSKWDTYDNTRAYIGVNTKYVNLKIGTIESNFNERSSGVGGIIWANYKKISLKSFYSYNEQFLQTLNGGSIDYQISQKIGISMGYAENVIEKYRNYTKILQSGIKFVFLKKNSLSIKTYLNNTTHAYATPFDKQGIAIFSNYSGNFNKIKVNISSEYGSPDYSGISRGRFIIYSGISYMINSKNLINLLYTKNDNINLFYVNDIQQPIQKNYYDKYELLLNKRIDKNFSVDIGSNVITESFNNPYVDTNPNMFFETFSPRVSFAIKFYNSSSKFYFKPKIDVGKVLVTNAENIDISTRSNYLTYNISLHSSYKNFSLYTLYRNGPNALYGKYFYYNSGYFTNWLFIMPSYNKSFFENTLNVDLRANYRYDIVEQNKTIALTSQLIYYMPKSWSLRFLNSISTQTKQDRVNASIYRYNTSYFELAIRKEFNCKQPRFQYYDLNIIFFKDLNGNRKKEKNEPGLRNVLASIEPDYEIEDSKVNKDFVAQKLLTGADGNIEYTNIVNGAYNVNYVLIGDMVGNFNREELSQQFIVDEDKIIYIPYLENNRILGKVILNRDPLSSLEQNIDISNIRVIAEDTKGHSYSALTDKQGRFILYTPVTDHYVVKINNIFYESFDIQQPEYIVKFNGYKQFEVTFVFDEKKKTINFNDPEVEDLKLDDIKVIRKTTLSGKIRDAISLEPIEAEIKIIDNKTNKVISRAISNRMNGNYSISYAAGSHFRVEVISKDYWEHVENLYIEQVISIQNINKDMMLNKLSESREEQKTFIIYDKEEKFEENFKRGQQIPINYLNFDLKQTRLDPKAKPELDRLIDLLNKNKSVKIEIAGHADDKGNTRIENIIAKRRAEAVKKYLISHGLPESRVFVKSYSNKRPLIPGTSEKARSKNRRVEIIVQ